MLFASLCVNPLNFCCGTLCESAKCEFAVVGIGANHGVEKLVVISIRAAGWGLRLLQFYLFNL